MVSVMPLYAFVEGDAMGVVVLGRPEETVEALAQRMLRATELRVARRGPFRIRSGERELTLRTTLGGQGVQPLDRIDLVWE
jgi:hypothetical protein